MKCQTVSSPLLFPEFVDGEYKMPMGRGGGVKSMVECKGSFTVATPNWSNRK